MKLSILKVLVGIILFTILLFLTAYVFVVPVLRVILGVSFLLFVPGFVLITALVPNRRSMSTTVRITLSLVLSIVVNGADGLLLNYLPYGITLSSVVISLTVFVLVLSSIAIIRQLALSPDDRPSLDFHFQSSKPTPGLLNTSLIIVMILVLAGALASGVYFSTAPKGGEAYTQFYLMQQGNGALYTLSGSTNNVVTFTVGITNNEGVPVNYGILALVNGAISREIDSIELSNGEKWSDTLALTINSAIQTQVELQIFKNDESKPYLDSLRVWIDPNDTNIVSQ